MKYAFNLAADGRIMSVTFPRYAPADAVVAESLPEGNVTDYRYEEGAFVYDPIPEPEAEQMPTHLDRIEAQLVYTAMMTDTLLEE